MIRKLIAATAAFAAGVMTALLAAVAWPLIDALAAIRDYEKRRAKEEGERGAER